MTLLASADNGRCNSRLMQNPGECDLGVREAAFVGDLRNTVHDREIFRPIVLPPGELIGLRANGVTVIFLTAVSDNKSPGERTKGSDPDTFRTAERQHFPFFFPIDHVVV